MYKKIMYIPILIATFSINSYACCGCSVVEASMSSLNSTFKMSLKAYDETSGGLYENNILSKINNNLVDLHRNFTALKENTLLEGLLNGCIDEINVETQKSIELKNLEKTQQGIMESEK